MATFVLSVHVGSGSSQALLFRVPLGILVLFQLPPLYGKLSWLAVKASHLLHPALAIPGSFLDEFQRQSSKGTGVLVRMALDLC